MDALFIKFLWETGWPLMIVCFYLVGMSINFLAIFTVQVHRENKRFQINKQKIRLTVLLAVRTK